MAKRSDTSPAALGAVLGSDAADNNNPPPPAPAAPTDASPAPNASQKRGRGRPPKSKSDSQPNGAVSAQPARKPSGRPKRNTAAVPAASASAAAVVRSGRGRPRRSSTLPATESLVTGSRKRGRPKKDDAAAAAAPAKKRGRKPKSGEVAKQRTSNRTRKATGATTGQGAAADPRELKKKVALLQKKVKQAAEKLQVAVLAIKEVQKIVDEI